MMEHAFELHPSGSDEERSKPLQELEGQDWGDGDFPSYLVRTTHALRRKPLRDFTVEDLRIMIGQNFSLNYLVPLAIEQLQRDPLAAGDFYNGDLLASVLKVRSSFWQKRPDLRLAAKEYGKIWERLLRGGMILDDIDLLPQALRKQSLSDREIVLPHQKALEALALLGEANWALLGWEGWVKYPDGRHGHTLEGVMGVEIEREEGETWEAYVERSVHFCRETMNREQQAWDANPRYVHLLLCFCLTAAPPTVEDSLLANDSSSGNEVHSLLKAITRDRPAHATKQLPRPVCPE